MSFKINVNLNKLFKSNLLQLVRNIKGIFINFYKMLFLIYIFKNNLKYNNMYFRNMIFEKAFYKIRLKLLNYIIINFIYIIKT